MSSTVRKFEREKQKDAYKRFKRSWGIERERQLALLNAGGTLKEGERQLGRCPPFPVYQKLVEDALAKQKEKLAAAQKELDSKVDLSWDEDETKKEASAQ